jgi:hypothetical protein
VPQPTHHRVPLSSDTPHTFTNGSYEPRIGIVYHRFYYNGVSLYLDASGIDLPISVTMHITAVLIDLSADFLGS